MNAYALWLDSPDILVLSLLTALPIRAYQTLQLNTVICLALRYLTVVITFNLPRILTATRGAVVALQPCTAHVPVNTHTRSRQFPGRSYALFAFWFGFFWLYRFGFGHTALQNSPQRSLLLNLHLVYYRFVVPTRRCTTMDRVDAPRALPPTPSSMPLRDATQHH